MADSQRRTVLVTDANRGSAIAVIRSLGRLGWRVIAGDSQARSAGFRSRFVSRRVSYPDPRRDALGVVDALETIARRERVDLIVPVTDEIVVPLSDWRSRFAGVSRIAIPSAEALEVTRDKAVTFQLAERLGISTPRTRVVSNVNAALEASKDLEWPIVVKPRRSRSNDPAGHLHAFEVSYAQNTDELVVQMKELARAGNPEALLQTYIHGEGHGVELLMEDGLPRVAFQHRRLREVPLSGGASALRESVPIDSDAYDDAVRLLTALQWTGLAMVEFKMTPSGQHLMEINGRIWGSLPLAVKSGVDFPALMAALWMGDPLPSSDPLTTGYRTGVRARNLSLELVWIGNVLLQRGRGPMRLPPRRAGLAAALSLVHPWDGFDTLDREDVGPALVEIAELARRLPRKLIGSR